MKRSCVSGESSSFLTNRRVTQRPKVVDSFAEEDHAGEHDVIAAALECLADDLLGFAAGIHVGGVDEVDPCVQGPVDDPDRVVVVGFPMAPNIMAPRP